MGVVTRHAIDTVSLEPLTGVDGQGKPSYGSPGNVVARVVLEDETTFATDGTEIKTQLTMWVPEGETWPEQGDRLTWQSVKYIVVERKERSSLVTGTDHVRVRAREE